VTQARGRKHLDLCGFSFCFASFAAVAWSKLCICASTKSLVIAASVRATRHPENVVHTLFIICNITPRIFDLPLTWLAAHFTRKQYPVEDALTTSSHRDAVGCHVSSVVPRLTRCSSLPLSCPAVVPSWSICPPTYRLHTRIL